MATAYEQGFTIDGWWVSPEEGLITRGEVAEHLEPKVMEVLVYLASRPGQVITREELEREVWRGALVGYDAVTATVIKLRKALQDNARQPAIIATIPKKGYQLIVPVEVIDTHGATVPMSSKTTLAQPAGSRRSWFVRLGAGSMIVVLILLAAWLGLSTNTKTPIPSIVVLPIENLDENAAHDVFADGITEDLITDLSRMSGLMVFASNTTFKYKGRQVTPQALYDELKVDYALKGSARRAGSEIRLNIQLVSIKTGFNIWAERYDRKIDEVFDVQDEITASVIDTLAIKLSTQEKQRLIKRATNNLIAYEYFLDGQRHSREQTMQANTQAREAYMRAIELDPAYGRAYGALAYTLALDYRHGWTNTPVENLERALELAEQAVRLDSSIPQTYWSLGYVHLRRNEYSHALLAAEEATRIAPNYADGYGLLALIHNGLAQPDKALTYATKGMRLNPYYTWDYLFNVGYAQYMLGDYSSAIAVLEKAQARNENVLPIKLVLAACYVRTARQEDAEWMIEQLQMLNPATTVKHVDQTITLRESGYKRKLLDDLRAAGLPE